MPPEPQPQADLEAEARMVAGRCSAERAAYLREVACCWRRGPDAADQLERLVAEILAARAVKDPLTAPR